MKNLRTAMTIIGLLILSCGHILAQRIRVNPVGVNVNSRGATTVFLTFGGVTDYEPAEATWCGELIPATPDLGSKCDPTTIFGTLPARFNLSTRSGTGGFTDIMSIPPSVARRAFQAAQLGADSAFFYVRRFLNLRGGPDEYVVVTCRMTEGGARSPFALTEVKLSFAREVPVLFLRPGERLPSIKAEISYNGTGRLKGRWEVVLPGEELPEAVDLLTEASLPVERRGAQRRYTQLERFNLFLPPSGRMTLSGPDVARLPTTVQGPYLILLRIEASDDRESDSSLVAVGAGSGIVHSGAVAGFPLPVLRYFVGGSHSQLPAAGTLALVEPLDRAVLPAGQTVNLVWMEMAGPLLYRVEVEDLQGNKLLTALLQPGVGVYRLPPWVVQSAASDPLRWRVAAVDQKGAVAAETEWRTWKMESVAGPKP
ncbi:MAG: hypothetical protein AB1898_07305 [Acidobacteriota bacterium]